jgi:hypothetical protein
MAGWQYVGRIHCFHGNPDDSSFGSVLSRAYPKFVSCGGAKK